MQHARVQGDRRVRFSVEIDAVIHRTNGSKLTARVSNFSDHGCRIEAEHDLHIGERLQIAVPRMGNVKAQVRWSLPGAAGTRFLTESDF
jgi:hypothetical protein